MASGPILSQLSNPLVMGPILILSAFLIAFLIYKKSDLSLSSGESFEAESLEDLVRPEMEKILKKFGKKNYSVIRRDLKTIGEAYREVRFTEANDYQLDDNNNVKTVSEDDIGELDDLVSAGIITEEQKRNLEGREKVPHRLIQTRPASSIFKVLWLFTDKIAGKEFFTDYFMIPEIIISESPGDESITISRNTQFRPFAGVYMPLYESSLGILRSATMRSLYDQALEDQANYHERVNFFDAAYSKNLQEIDAEAEAEKKKYQSGVAGDAGR